jgi:enterochelin esterase-like enzyme
MPFTTLGPLHLPGFESRQVWVYSPPGDAPEQRRPLLVLLDGQNAFEFGPSGGWESHRALEALDPRRAVVPRVVAVPHGQARADELCPWPTWPGGPGGRAFAFFDHLADRVLPEVRRRFHTPEGAIGGVLGGASWGGMAALVGHYARPDAFGGALCLSPAFWVGRFAALDWLDTQPTPRFSRIYVDCGEREARGTMYPAAQRMVQKLKDRGYPARQLKWQGDPDGTHSETSWRRRLPEALHFMYGE